MTKGGDITGPRGQEIVDEAGSDERGQSLAGVHPHALSKLLLAPSISRTAPRVGNLPHGYRQIQERFPIFAVVGLLCLLVGIIPFPKTHLIEVYVAGGIFILFTILALRVPWEKVPPTLWAIVPVGYLATVALLRDAQGGGASGLSALYLLPVVWLALFGKRSLLAIGLLAMTGALVLPVFFIGGKDYPHSEWRMIIVMVVGAALVSYSFFTSVNEEREAADDVAAQALLIQDAADLAEAARDRLSALLHAATHTAIIGTNPSGTVTFFSAGAARMFGYDETEIIGRLFAFDLFDKAEIAEHRPKLSTLARFGPFEEFANEKEVKETTFKANHKLQETIWTFRRKDGTTGQMSVVVTPQTSANRIVGYVMVASDVTDQELLKAEREQLFLVQSKTTQVLVEQNEQLRELTKMKDDVVATVSHEMRTPLTSIRGYIELLLDSIASSLTEDQAQMFRTIDRNSEHLLRVTEDLLSQPKDGGDLHMEFLDIDIAQLLANVIESMDATAFAADIVVSLAKPEGTSPIMVKGDASRLLQIFVNLLSNSIKFSRKGRQIQVVLTQVDGFSRVDVMDQGSGIPVFERLHLFDRFYRMATSELQGIPGSGLGLAIAKSIVDAHHGTIRIIDTPGWATTLRVDLPLADIELKAGHGSSSKTIRSVSPRPVGSGESKMTPAPLANRGAMQKI